MPWWLWLLLAIVGLTALWVVFQFNRMVSLRNRVRESWGNVEVELQRRHDLVPNLVETVKGAARQETTVFRDVAAARVAAMRSRGQAADERQLVAGMQRLLAIAEDHPRLQSSRNFLQLQQELAVTEDRIAAARRFHNGNVRSQRDQVLQWPGNLLAQVFGFAPEPFYEVGEVRVLAVPKVALDGLGVQGG